MGKNKKSKKRKKDRKGQNGTTRAQRADKYDLYQRSVQEPSVEVDFFDRAYKAIHGRKPKTLREDFCGTFAVCCNWVKTAGRTATAVDLDPEPLGWGRDHNLSRLKPEAQSRVRILQDDVRTIDEERFDVVAAQNFSYWIFKTRDELRTYFEIARQNLTEGGIFVVDLMGGGECYQENEPEERKYKGFKYYWELTDFDPISNHATHHIHYGFKDGSRIERAFEYSWRFWTLPEIREVLAEAGFSKSTVYWEEEDEKGEGTGDWKPAETGSCDPSWIAYVVAEL